MTATPDQPHAPGCFGSALCFQAGSPECSSCPFQGACQPAAQRRTQELRTLLGLALKEPRLKKPIMPPVAPDAAQRTLPKKVEELLGRIERAGIRVTDSLNAGLNPFAKGPTFLKMACHLLLRMPEGFTRQQLQQGLMTKLAWTQATANAHATQACQLLIAVGAAKLINGKLVRKQ